MSILFTLLSCYTECCKYGVDLKRLFHLADKPDGTFSRSRSSSINSLDNINKEAIQCLVFSDSYARKLGKRLFRLHVAFA